MEQLTLPKLLDDDQQQEVLDALTKGGSLEMAARLVRCSTRTLSDNIDSNETFRELIDQARAEYELGLLSKLTGEAKYWRAAAWALERMFPDRYAARKPDTLTFTEFMAMIDQLLTVIDPELKNKEVCARIQMQAHLLCIEASDGIDGVLEVQLDQRRENES